MENFYLEPTDELFSIIDKIKRSRDREITLVVPSGLSDLRSIINLKILKEEAISLGKDISILTSDVLIKKLAQQANIMTLDKPAEKAEPIQAGPPQSEGLGGEPETKDSWPKQLMTGGDIRPGLTPQTEKRVISDIVKPKEPAEKAEPIQAGPPASTQRGEPQSEDLGGEPRFVKEEPEELIEVTSPTPVQPETETEERLEDLYKPEKIKPSFRFFTKKRAITIFITLCLVGGGFALYFFLPNAQIHIIPKTEAIRFETDIIVDKNINSVDLSENSVPGQVFQLEMEDSKKFPTTGEKDVEEKARGTITVYNQYSSDPQALVKTTRFLSKKGELFRLLETTVIPGATIVEGKIVASEKEVDVIADEAGEKYNIEPSEFTIPGFEGTPKYNAFYGESLESMSGGAKGKMRVATKDDIEGALEIVSLELKNKAQDEFDKKIPEELMLLKDTQILELIQASSSLGPDEPGKELLITAKVKVWGLAFKEDDIFHLVEGNVSDKVSENKTLVSSSIKVDYVSTNVNSEQGKADFSCKIDAEAAWKIDIEEIRGYLAGKNEVEVRKYLSSLSEIDSARVVFWPFWVKTIPKNKEKIKIVVDPSPN